MELETPRKGKHNNTLQATFDPLPVFAAAKTAIASNAPERGRYEPSMRKK